MATRKLKIELVDIRNSNGGTKVIKVKGELVMTDNVLYAVDKDGERKELLVYDSKDGYWSESDSATKFSDYTKWSDWNIL